MSEQGAKLTGLPSGAESKAYVEAFEAAYVLAKKNWSRCLRSDGRLFDAR